VSKLASRRQKSRALQSTPCAAKRPAQDRRSWRSLSSEKPRRGNACWRREIRLLAVLGRLKDCARVYTNRIFLRREAFLGLRTRIFFALCQGNMQVYARKNAVKSSREKRGLAQGSSLPSRHPNRKTFGYQPRSCAERSSSCPRSTADRKRSTAHTGQMHSVQTSARSFAAPMVSAVVSPFT
jgi:hypothetical protein